MKRVSPVISARRIPSAAPIRVWSVVFVLLAAGWWWVTRTHAGSWWWAALLNIVPPQVLLPLPLWQAWQASRARKRGWVLLNLLAAAVFTVAVVGFMLPKAGRPHSGTPLTVLTLNTNYASAPPSRIAEMALREKAQVVLLQEALNHNRQGAAYAAQVQAAFPGWTVVRHDELLTISRLPVLKKQAVDFPRSAHSVLLTQVRLGTQTVVMVNVHLPTLALLPNQSDKRLGRGLPQRVQHSLDIRRDFQGVMAAILRDYSGPLVLAGDLNTPARGGVNAQLRYLKLQDAFARSGVGLGFTHYALFGHSRLDYVWTRDLDAEHTAPLLDFVSDHRALVAHLRLPALEQAK